MNKHIKNPFLSILCFVTLSSHWFSFSLPSQSKLLDYAVKAASAGVILTVGHHFFNAYIVDTTSVDNFLTQLQYLKYRSERFLNDYDNAYREHGLLDAAIIAQYAGYPYPAITYYSSLKDLIKDLVKLQSAFERKQSKTKSDAQWSKLDQCIQAITILKARLEALKDLVPHSKSYKMEKAACKWPIKTAVIGTTLGFLAGFGGLIFIMKIGAMPSDFYEFLFPKDLS